MFNAVICIIVMLAIATVEFQNCVACLRMSNVLYLLQCLLAELKPRVCIDTLFETEVIVAAGHERPWTVLSVTFGNRDASFSSTLPSSHIVPQKGFKYSRSMYGQPLPYL